MAATLYIFSWTSNKLSEKMIETDAINATSKITMQELVGKCPCWIEFLPDAFDGNRKGVHVMLAISNAALNNNGFDVYGFIRCKLIASLHHLLKKHKIKILYLYNDCRVLIDTTFRKDRSYFHVFFDYDITEL